ncbi:MAG: hypothetical protein ATN33_03180 [Epulopiscium sp. Nele67-Bin001]|nr:MAG: hypothetical protein ATN33_03180 [Epulopiscium sp. Nele67-Bin001]
MRLIPVSQLRVDSVLALDIIDEHAKILLAKGHTLNQMNLSRLRTTNVASVYITDEYCFNDNTNYTSQPSNILRRVIIVKRLMKMVSAGTTTKEAVFHTLKAVYEMVDGLDQQKYSLRLVYEPKKILVNTFEENIIYIAIMSALFALKLGFSKKEASYICLGALVRDIALISYNFQEQEMNTPATKEHPIKGYNHLKTRYNLPEEVLEIVIQHQETYDGKGYPYGLKGEQICTGARIIAIIDMYYKIKTTNMSRTAATLEEDFKRWTAHLDPTYIKKFLEFVNIYDPDTLVKLTNGDCAVVTSSRPINPFRPQIKIVKSAKFNKEEIINLSDRPELHIHHILYYID